VTFDRPVWLLLLSALPVLWWLHRLIAAPRVLTVASVEALRGVVTGTPADRPSRRWDVELALLLAAVCCLGLAAAGPRLATAAPSVLIVVDTSSSGDLLGVDGVALRRSALVAAEAALVATGVAKDVELLELGSSAPPLRRAMEDLAAPLP